MTKLRVGLDFRRQSDDGTGRVTNLIFGALLELRPKVEILLLAGKRNPVRRPPRGVEITSFDYPLISDTAFEQLPDLIRRARIDVFIGPQFYVLPILPCRFISILHDAYPFHSDGYLPTMKELLDLFGELSIERLRVELGDYVPAGWAMTNEDAVLSLYYGMYQMNAACASRIATVSEHSRADLSSYFPDAAARIDIVSPYVSDSLIRAPTYNLDGARGPELLHVGKWEPRKRHDLLLKAAELCRMETPDLRLHLVGAPWMALLSHSTSVRRSLERCRNAGWLRWSESVSDAILASSYRFARATVLVPSFEGFGLPALEAMTLGCPLATTGAGALGEICGDTDLRLPDDPEGIADLLTRLWQDKSLRSSLRYRGLQHSRKYSVRRTSKELAICLYRALETESGDI